jgi:glycerol-3-phosphate dehydrogenase
MTHARTGARRIVMARALVNAGGPWVNDIIGRVTGTNSTRAVRLVKGSHIIVPKFWEGTQAYLVQNHDRRVIFINPYEGDKALIGTTDIPYEGAAEKVAASEDEVTYLIAAVNRYFTQALRREDVLETFSGVRPLYDDGAGNPSAVTRDYVFDLDNRAGAPLLNIFGGKITTFRKLAEHAMQRLAPHFPGMGGDWTASGTLPGGELPGGDIAAFLNALARDYPWLPRDVARHYARLYGTLTRDLIGRRQSLAELGIRFGPLLYEAEVRYLVTQEWAETADDILWRRTKHRLHMSAAEQAAFAEWFDQASMARSA